MTRTMWSTAGTIVAAAFWLVGGSVTAQEADAQAQADAQAEAQAEGSAQLEPGSVQPQTLFSFAGGGVKRFVARVQDAPIQIGETAGFNLLPGSTTTMTVPAGQVDIFVVTFSGECRLFNASSEDWVQLEVRRNGIPVEPHTASGDTMAFCSDDNWNTHSATFVTPRVGAGNHTFTVRWRLVDNAPFATLRGWLDDWTFLVQQHD
jgi:hypothetical protein